MSDELDLRLRSVGDGAPTLLDLAAVERAAARRRHRGQAAAVVMALVAVGGVVGAAQVVTPDVQPQTLSAPPLEPDDGQVVKGRPTASPTPAPVRTSLDDDPALVVHNKAEGAAARAADSAVRTCLRRPGVDSRRVDAAEPAAYVVTADAQERLSEVAGCLAAVAGVLVEREIEGLAGQGPVPVATMPGGGPVYRDDSQQALAEQLQGQLYRLVEAALPGEVEEHSVNYATTRTPTGPSRNIIGVVQWHDERGHVTLAAHRIERFAGTSLDACSAKPSSELDCVRVTAEGGDEQVTVFTANSTQGDRTAVRLVADGSAVTVMQTPHEWDASERDSSGRPRQVTARPDLPLSDEQLAAMAVSLAE